MSANLEVEVARHDERIGALEDRADKQNGRIEKIEARMDRIEGKLNAIGWGVAATLGSVVVELIMRLIGR
ncbi:MAG: hypothetical protein HPY55_16220 [Firmicutes bacterium]|nr:hypothetical protein [Bacillota bacterium]